MEKQFQEQLKHFRNKSDKKTFLSIINKALGKVISKPLKESTARNLEKELLFPLDEEIKKRFRENHNIVSQHWANPKDFFNRKRPQNSSISDKYKARFDKFLEGAVDTTYRYYTDETKLEILNQKWSYILFFYGVVLKGYSKVKKEGIETNFGRPPKIDERIFIKCLYLVLSTLRINKKSSASILAAIQAFLVGYLNLRKDIQTIRQDIYR